MSRFTRAVIGAFGTVVGVVVLVALGVISVGAPVVGALYGFGVFDHSPPAAVGGGKASGFCLTLDDYTLFSVAHGHPKSLQQKMELAVGIERVLAKGRAVVPGGMSGTLRDLLSELNGLIAVEKSVVPNMNSSELQQVQKQAASLSGAVDGDLTKFGNWYKVHC